MKRRRIRHGGDLQGGVICRRCNAQAVNLAGGEVRCGEIGAVISPAETSEAVKCSAPIQTCNDTVIADCIGMTAPKFQLFLKSVLGEVGKEAVFQCQIHGEPAPVITW